MRATKNILTDKEMELVGILMADCQSTGDIQAKLKRLFAGTIEQMLENIRIFKTPKNAEEFGLQRPVYNMVYVK